MTSPLKSSQQNDGPNGVYRGDGHGGSGGDNRKNEPIFNLPDVILYLILAMVAMHVVRDSFLSETQDYAVLLEGAFISDRYRFDWSEQSIAYFTSPVSYSFLHGDYIHLILNCVWLAAFGSVVARRIGAIRFSILWVSSSAFAALFFLALNWGQTSLLIGASGAVSAMMGAAARFAFPHSGRFARDKAHFLPRQSFAEVFTNKTVVIYLAIWFGINLFPAIGVGLAGENVSTIAWEAHIGGFLVGFLGFDLFDRRNW